MIQGVVALFQRLDTPAGVTWTFVAIYKALRMNARLDDALATALWLVAVADEATRTGFIATAMPVTYQTIHSAGSEQGRVNDSRHFHRPRSTFK